MNDGVKEQGRQLLRLFARGNSYIEDGFQPHIFIVIIPLTIIFLCVVVYKKRLQSLSIDQKVTLNYLTSIVLTAFITFNILFVGRSFIPLKNLNFDTIARSLLNYDMLLMVVINLALIFKKFGVVRSLAPISAVYALASIISNPGQAIYASHIVFDIMLAIVPTFVTVMTMKNISCKSFVLSEIFNLLAFTFIALVNEKTGRSYSGLTASILSRNEFYSMFVTGEGRIAFWIFSVFIFEFVAWIILRFALENRRTVYNIKTFWRSMQMEVHTEIIDFLVNSNNFFEENEFVALERNELNNVDQYFIETSQIDKIEAIMFTEIDTSEETEFVDNYTSILLKTPIGTRSPSAA